MATRLSSEMDDDGTSDRPSSLFKRRKTLGLNSRIDDMVCRLGHVRARSKNPRRSHSTSSRTEDHVFSDDDQLSGFFDPNARWKPEGGKQKHSWEDGKITDPLPDWLSHTVSSLTGDHPLRLLLPRQDTIEPSPQHRLDSPDLHTQPVLNVDAEANNEPIFAYDPFQAEVEPFTTISPIRLEYTASSRGLGNLSRSGDSILPTLQSPSRPPYASMQAVCQMANLTPFSTPGPNALLVQPMPTSSHRPFTDLPSPYNNTLIAPRTLFMHAIPEANSPEQAERPSDNVQLYLEPAPECTSRRRYTDSSPNVTHQSPIRFIPPLQPAFSCPPPSKPLLSSASRTGIREPPSTFHLHSVHSVDDHHNPGTSDVDIDFASLDFRWTPFSRKAYQTSNPASPETRDAAGIRLPLLYEGTAILPSSSDSGETEVFDAHNKRDVVNIEQL